MLVGQYTSKLTDKNRISVPSKIRGILGKKMIVARWYENCLVLVSKNNWQKLIKRIVGKPSLIISPVRDIDRFIYGSAFEVETDDQGRFVLTEDLKQYAGINKEVIIVGLNDRVEIWSSEKWKELERTSEKKASEAIEKLAKIEK